MICDACRRRLARLRADAKAAWTHDAELDAIVWADDRVAGLCGECARLYAVVLNVRTQLLMGETPSPEFQFQVDRFRESLPEWIGFRRAKLTAAQKRSCRGPALKPRREEIVDED